MADLLPKNDQRPQFIADGPQPTPPIITDGSPSSSNEKTHKALLDSPENPFMDINEKQDPLSLGDHSSSPSQRDRILPPALSAQGCEADFDKTHSAQEKGLELIPLQDDPDCLVVTLPRQATREIIYVDNCTNNGVLYPDSSGDNREKLCINTRPELVESGKYVLHQKETGFSAIMATTAGLVVVPSEIISVYELYFGRAINFGVALGMLGGAQLLAYGMAGLLQPILIYPSQAVYPEALPSVSLLNSLFKVGTKSNDQVNFFKKAFLAIGIYEIFPTYIAPALQAINVFCLTLPKNQLITNIFGGARPFEGMGLFTISLDWSMAGGRGPLFMPLNTQIHEIVALVISIFSFFFVYSKSWHELPVPVCQCPYCRREALPISTSHQADGTANEEFIQSAGLPFFTATFYLIQILTSVYLTSSLSHAALNNYHHIGPLLKKSKSREDIDPHRVVCQKYRDFPPWGFAVMVVVSFALTFGMSSATASGVSVVSLLVAMIVSFLMTLAAGFISAVTGFQVRLTSGIQMLGGLMFPGNVFQSMWFTLYGASSAMMAMGILRDIKFGQYVHLPQYHIVFSQLMGGSVGTLANILVTKAILKNERDVLISAQGNGVFSGAEIAASQARAIRFLGNFFEASFSLWPEIRLSPPLARFNQTRSFIYLSNGAIKISHTPVFFINCKIKSAVSWGMVVGLFLPIPFFVAGKRWPRYKFNLFNVPLLLGITTGFRNLSSRLSNVPSGICRRAYAYLHRVNVAILGAQVSNA
ncbi:hypothetical protein PSTT_03340, partial [Puccinia striiformis]